MQIVLEQIEREKRDASDLVVGYPFLTIAAPCKQEIEIFLKKNRLISERHKVL